MIPVIEDMVKLSKEIKSAHVVDLWWRIKNLKQKMLLFLPKTYGSYS